MKTIDYFLIIFLCLCLSACNSNSEPEVEEPEIEEPCPDLADINARFAYSDSPSRAVRLAYMGMERPADSYNFPLYPGMDGWADLKHYTEMKPYLEVTPACLLSKMSTQALIQAVWEYPDMPSYFSIAGYAFQRSIERRRITYNFFEELYNRKDAGVALLQRLTVVDPLTPFLEYESQMLELLLSRPDFLSQLNENEKRKTVEIALSHDAKRYVAWWVDVGDSGKGLGLEVRPVTWILIGNTMHVAGYGPLLEAMNENEELKWFIEGWMRHPSEPGTIMDYYYTPNRYGNIPDLIMDYAKKYIND